MPSRRTSLAAIAVLAAFAPVAHAQDSVPATEDEACACEDADVNDYDEAGVVEVGGSVGLDWTDDLFTIDVGPTIGWFVFEGFEISLIAKFLYENEEEDDGSRTRTRAGSLVLEPSYHFPLYDESLFGFGGLGLGGGYDGDDPDFEIIPRVGLNIEIGRAGVLTPALRVPILMGPGKGGDDDEFGVQAGFGFEAGFTTTL